jgi:hypothetical protein
MAEAGLAAHGTVVCQHLPRRIPARLAIERGYLERSATSQLAILTEEEYRGGRERLRADIAAAEARNEELVLEADLRLYATVGVAS